MLNRTILRSSSKFFKLFKNSFNVLHNLGLIKKRYFKKALKKMTLEIYMQIIHITLL